MEDSSVGAPVYVSSLGLDEIATDGCAILGSAEECIVGIGLAVEMDELLYQL